MAATGKTSSDVLGVTGEPLVATPQAESHTEPLRTLDEIMERWHTDQEHTPAWQHVLAEHSAWKAIINSTEPPVPVEYHDNRVVILDAPRHIKRSLYAILVSALPAVGFPVASQNITSSRKLTVHIG